VAAVATVENTLSYVDEQRKLEELQREFRSWLETKEDIVRLADRRDQLLAFLNAKYGYRAEAAVDAPVGDPMLLPRGY
jgi:hypothetical protein